MKCDKSWFHDLLPNSTWYRYTTAFSKQVGALAPSGEALAALVMQTFFVTAGRCLQFSWDP
jgi:hypothetical protein